MDKKLGALLIILVLTFSLFISYVVFNQQIKTFTRASEELQPSAEKSLIFAWPLSAKADGKEKVMINVFVRNEKNQPLANKNVSLKTTLGQVDPSNQTTDKSGKTTFNLISNETGIAQIQAFIDNQVSLKQTITIKFE
ncbi:MAG: Ig-like domain-containing protein [Patescibacteria group bacterium]|nr:Ig-like domain-containing protein [Patescibacteria group bacterium]